MNDDIMAEMKAWADEMQTKLDGLEYESPMTLTVDLAALEHQIAREHPTNPDDYRRSYREKFKNEVWIWYYASIEDLKHALTAIVGEE